MIILSANCIIINLQNCVWLYLLYLYIYIHIFNYCYIDYCLYVQNKNNNLQNFHITVHNKHINKTIKIAKHNVYKFIKYNYKITIIKLGGFKVANSF